MRIPNVSAILPVLLALSTLFAGCVMKLDDPDPDPLSTGGIFPGAKTGTLYFSVNDDESIYAYDIDESEITRLVAGSDPAIATDGALICRHPAGLVEYAPDSDNDGYRLIVRRNRDASDDQTYDDEFHSPQVSHDGKYVAYQGDEYDVHVVDRTSGALLATLTDEGYSHPSWTPDNRLVMAGGVLKNGLYISDIDWRNVMPLGPQLPGALTPTVSPDGETILFSYNQQLFTIGIDGMNLELSVEVPGINPCWAPEGTYYAFAMGSPDAFSAHNVCLFNPSSQIMIEPFFETGEPQWWTEMGSQVTVH